MYKNLTNEQKNIQQIIYSQTPIDTIISTYDLPNCIEVRGYAGGDSLIYRVYNNGTVVEK